MRTYLYTRPQAAVFVVCAALLASCASTAPPSPRIPPPTQSESNRTVSQDTLGFVIIGDTGVQPPEGNLDKTSKAVAEFCREEAKCGFMLMSGDNIYPKGASADPAKDAPVFKTLFTDPFAPFAASNPGAPVVVALGNHDWYNSREGALAQVAFHEQNRPFYMNGLFYRYRVSDDQGGVDVFVVDTEMLLSTMTLPDYDSSADGAMIATGKTDPGGDTNARPVTDAEKQQLKWLERALASSDARWKFILAHHPLWQGRPDSKYAQSIALRELLLPMACRHADAYFAGHQHSIELHEDDCSSVAKAEGLPTNPYAPLPVVVSGAGAKERSVSSDFARWQSHKFPQNTVRISWGDRPGFVGASLANGKLSITPIKVMGDGARQPGDVFKYGNRPDRP